MAAPPTQPALGVLRRSDQSELLQQEVEEDAAVYFFLLIALRGNDFAVNGFEIAVEEDLDGPDLQAFDGESLFGLHSHRVMGVHLCDRRVNLELVLAVLQSRQPVAQGEATLLWVLVETEVLPHDFSILRVPVLEL